MFSIIIFYTLLSENTIYVLFTIIYFANSIKLLLKKGIMKRN